MIVCCRQLDLNMKTASAIKTGWLHSKRSAQKYEIAVQRLPNWKGNILFFLSWWFHMSDNFYNQTILWLHVDNLNGNEPMTLWCLLVWSKRMFFMCKYCTMTWIWPFDLFIALSKSKLHDAPPPPPVHLIWIRHLLLNPKGFFSKCK